MVGSLCRRTLVGREPEWSSLKWSTRLSCSASIHDQMDTNTLLIIVVLVLLLGGGGFYFRGRR
jgi:LPXTG-motif cell wall-anchored protein